MNDDENELLWKLSKDLKAAVPALDREQARFLVDAYYSMQKNRMATGGQVRAMTKSGEPHAVLDWVKERSGFVEKQIAVALKCYAESQHMGQWAMNVDGIGPVIAAGLLAHIDITKAPTVGHIWAFAGLDPTKKWKKGEKRPWNASLKTLCWKIGESFVKVSGNPDAMYARLYKERKEQEQAKNERGDFAEQAKAGAERVGKGTEAYKYYKEGKLPPGHIHARAKRYAVKLFLSHWHHEAYRDHFKTEPPKPYPIAILGHTHEIKASFPERTIEIERAISPDRTSCGQSEPLGRRAPLRQSEPCLLREPLKESEPE